MSSPTRFLRPTTAPPFNPSLSLAFQLLLVPLLACGVDLPAAHDAGSDETGEVQASGNSAVDGPDGPSTGASQTDDGDDSDGDSTGDDDGRTETSTSDGDEGCAPSGEGQSDPFIDCVESINSPQDSFHNHDMLPAVVIGPPRGSLDTVSLGCAGELIVFFDDPVIVDGPGVDFIVFENAFMGFPEPAQVSVSEDGVDWVSFDCDPQTLMGCAGVATVEAIEGSELDPTDPQVAGGDQFDLANIGVQRARYLRFDDLSEGYWGAMGMDWCDPGQGGKAGFDLDAAAIVNAESI